MICSYSTKAIISASMKSWEAIVWSPKASGAFTSQSGLRMPNKFMSPVISTAGKRKRIRSDPGGNQGIWEGFIPGVLRGAKYKYYIRSRYQGYRVEKADPFSIFYEGAPAWRPLSGIWTTTGVIKTGSAGAGSTILLRSPISIYGVHWGPGCGFREDGDRPLSYREIAPKLADYVKQMGFTHVEFMPVMEHPFYGSWGYQTPVTSLPPAGTAHPQDFMYSSTRLHQDGIGVILDWVPSHFPADEHGWATSTARIFTSTRTRARVSTRTGTALSSTTAGTRSELPDQQRLVLAGQVSRRRPAGGRGGFNALSGLFPARKASGFPIFTAARKISTRSGSCENSTKRSTAASRILRPLPKSPPTGPWSPAHSPGRPGLRPQVGHGLDARHFAIYVPRARASALPS